MKVLYCASECVPFVKTGGLADVAGSLPIALKNAGADVRVMLPKYKRRIDAYWLSRMEHVCEFTLLFGWERVYCGVERVVDNGVTYYFIDNETFFDVDQLYGDGIYEGFRFAFFSRAILEALPHIDFFPDVLHLNDWQTGLVPALLKTQYMTLPHYPSVKTVFSIHNLKYQGVFDYAPINGRLGFEERYFTPEFLEFYGKLNCMKGALVFADKISTVSPTYAAEITTDYYGEQMDGLLRARGDGVTGILNGLDTVIFDPATDRYLQTHYTADDLAGKREEKALLQKEVGLAVRQDVPVVGFIARLTPQKGLDLVERVLDDILKMDLQLVFLGDGDKHYRDMLNWAGWRYPGKLAFHCGLNEGLAHRIYAGSDLFLMPSAFEPCGLSQMIALRYGSVPVVRETGGLRDTVQPYNCYTGEGNGFSFANFNAHEMLFTLEYAVRTFYENPDAWNGLMMAGMRGDYGWLRSAEAYLALYESTRPPMPAPRVKKPRKKKSE